MDNAGVPVMGASAFGGTVAVHYKEFWIGNWDIIIRRNPKFHLVKFISEKWGDDPPGFGGRDTYIDILWWTIYIRL